MVTTFLPQQIIFRGSGLILYTNQTRRNPTQPKSPIARNIMIVWYWHQSRNWYYISIQFATWGYCTSINPITLTAWEILRKIWECSRNVRTLECSVRLRDDLGVLTVYCCTRYGRNGIVVPATTVGPRTSTAWENSPKKFRMFTECEDPGVLGPPPLWFGSTNNLLLYQVSQKMDCCTRDHRRAPHCLLFLSNVVWAYFEVTVVLCSGTPHLVSAQLTPSILVFRTCSCSFRCVSCRVVSFGPILFSLWFASFRFVSCRFVSVLPCRFVSFRFVPFRSVLCWAGWCCAGGKGQRSRAGELWATYGRLALNGTIQVLHTFTAVDDSVTIRSRDPLPWTTSDSFDHYGLTRRLACSFYGSHPATWARSHRSRTCLPWNI